MKIKNIGKWTVCALVALPLLACSSSERVEDKMMVDDGAVLISGDLTYEKAMEALAPLMTKNDVAVMKIIENGQIGQPVAVDAQLREIKVSSVVHLYFTQSDEVTARLEVPARLKDYIKVTYANGRLEAGSSQTNMKSHWKLLEDEEVNLYVSAPRLESLELSGATRAQLGDINQAGPVDIVAVGASKVVGKTIRSNAKVRVNCSGAAELVFKEIYSVGDLAWQCSGSSRLALDMLTGTTYFFDCSGASKLTVTRFTHAADMKVTNSGASRVNVTGNADRVKLNNSGASKVVFTGKAGSLDVDCSGASKAILAGSADDANLSVSGVGKIDATAMKIAKASRHYPQSPAKIEM